MSRPLNLSLNACTLPLSPYISTPPNPNDIAITYLHHLESNLNITTTLTPWNSTPSDLLTALTEPNPPCHFAVAPITITNTRLAENTFLWPFASEAHQMIIAKEALNPSSTPWFVFHTFSSKCWLFLLIGILLHAIGTVAFSPPIDKGNRRAKTRAQLRLLPAAILKAYAHLVGHPVGQAGSKQTPSFHRTSWLILGLTAGLFLLVVYEASLTVLLFESVKKSPFESLEDIKSCIISPERVAMVEGSASQEFWNVAVNTTSKREKCNWGVAGVTVRDFEQGFQKLLSREIEYFFDLEGPVSLRANSECGLFQVVGEPFFSTGVAFVVQKGFSQSVVEALNRETRVLRERDAFPSAKILASGMNCDERAAAKVKASNLWAFFGMYGGLWTVLLLYRCAFLRKREKQGREMSEGGDGLEVGERSIGAEIGDAG